MKGSFNQPGAGGRAPGAWPCSRTVGKLKPDLRIPVRENVGLFARGKQAAGPLNGALRKEHERQFAARVGGISSPKIAQRFDPDASTAWALGWDRHDRRVLVPQDFDKFRLFAHTRK